MCSIQRGTPKDKVYQRDLLVSEDSLIQLISAHRNVRGHQGYVVTDSFRKSYIFAHNTYQ